MITSMRINLFNYYMSQKERLIEHHSLLTESFSLRDADELTKEPVLKTLEELRKLYEENEYYLIKIFRLKKHLDKVRRYYASKSKLTYQLKMNEEYYHAYRNAVAKAHAMPEKWAEGRINKLTYDQIESLDKMARMEEAKMWYVNFLRKGYRYKIGKLELRKKKPSSCSACL